MTRKELGTKIAERRFYYFKSQKKLAEHLGVQQQKIHNIEAGKTKNLDVFFLIKLSIVLEFNFLELLADDMYYKEEQNDTL